MPEPGPGLIPVKHAAVSQHVNTTTTEHIHSLPSHDMIYIYIYISFVIVILKAY